MSDKALPKPDGAAIAYGAQDLAEIGAIRKATPTVQEVARAVGVPVRTEPNPQTGRPEVVADLGAMDKRKVGVLTEMMSGAWRKDTERQAQLDANRPKETLVGRDGKRRRVWSAVSENVAKSNGSRPAIYWGRSTGTSRFYLECGHYVERSESPASSECPWGCGVQSVVERGSWRDAPPSVHVH